MEISATWPLRLLVILVALRLLRPARRFLGALIRCGLGIALLAALQWLP